MIVAWTKSCSNITSSNRVGLKIDRIHWKIIYKLWDKILYIVTTVLYMDILLIFREWGNEPGESVMLVRG